MFQGPLPPKRSALAALDRSATPTQWLGIVTGLHDEAEFWWLDSAQAGPPLGRYSFAGSDPYLVLNARGNSIQLDVRRAVWPELALGCHRVEADPLDFIRSLLPRPDELQYSKRRGGTSPGEKWRMASGQSAGFDLPFVGGMVGFLGYELGETLDARNHFENRDDLELPDLYFAFVDQVLAYDHVSERLWILGSGFGSGVEGSGSPCAGEVALRRSRERADALSNRVERVLFLEAQHSVEEDSAQKTDLDGSTDRRRRRGVPKTTIPSFRSTVDSECYAKTVDSIQEEIADGNVYQVNFSQRLMIEAPVDPWNLYLSLRHQNPAPFGGLIRLPGAAILSSSPERFLRLDQEGVVVSRPIKGTRPRGKGPEDDLLIAQALSESEKDRAENLMIVDLVRNDLGRVCTPGSIEVRALMEIEAYAEVFQMVSTIEGKLAEGRDGMDLVRATFPPGSMTGAPKLAAMALIEELEIVRRGVYAGALGFFDLRGGLDLSVVIRTIVWKEGRAYLSVGGGVVSDSSPDGEYQESLDKARAPLLAVGRALAKKPNGSTKEAAR